MTTCEEVLQEDVDLSGASEVQIPAVSAFDDLLEKVSVLLVETQKKLELTEHYLQEALQRNQEQETKIKCLELENKLLNQMIEKQIGRGDRCVM